MAITLTDSAANRVRTFLMKRGSGIGLRLGVKKTGCSGFSYIVNYADEVGADDVVFDIARAPYLLDRVHRGAVRIDRVEVLPDRPPHIQLPSTRLLLPSRIKRNETLSHFGDKHLPLAKPNQIHQSQTA